MTIPPATKAVTIEDFSFKPSGVTISVGDKVRWTNTDAAPHRVGVLDGAKWTNTLSDGQAGTMQFDATGTFNYVCQIHTSMKGTVTVNS